MRTLGKQVVSKREVISGDLGVCEKRSEKRKLVKIVKSYKLLVMSSEDVMYSMVTIVDNTILYV